MKLLLRSKISLVASYVEIILSVLLVLGISYSLMQVIHNNILYQYFNYEIFLADVLKLIIGVEFVKMLCKHSLGSAIDVLIFAAARKIVIAHYTGNELVLAVVSVAILFVVRKYFNYDNKKKYVE
ncbi:MAG: hypothetical protein K0S71_2859 [Clostridia bacterium]|jgi:hypothetical protein|nr:hypothetical protein [Clostridia bacterium]